jgi:hypothetical protein
MFWSIFGLGSQNNILIDDFGNYLTGEYLFDHMNYSSFFILIFSNIYFTKNEEYFGEFIYGLTLY